MESERQRLSNSVFATSHNPFDLKLDPMYQTNMFNTRRSLNQSSIGDAHF